MPARRLLLLVIMLLAACGPQTAEDRTGTMPAVCRSNPQACR